jgi:hypothetical protein
VFEIEATSHALPIRSSLHRPISTHSLTRAWPLRLDFLSLSLSLSLPLQRDRTGL